MNNHSSAIISGTVLIILFYLSVVASAQAGFEVDAVLLLQAQKSLTNQHPDDAITALESQRKQFPTSSTTMQGDVLLFKIQGQIQGQVMY